MNENQMQEILNIINEISSDIYGMYGAKFWG